MVNPRVTPIPRSRRQMRRSRMIRDTREFVVGALASLAICGGIAVVIGLFIRLVLWVAGT